MYNNDVGKRFMYSAKRQSCEGAELVGHSTEGGNYCRICRGVC